MIGHLHCCLDRIFICCAVTLFRYFLMMPWIGEGLDKGFQKAVQGRTWISVINWTYHDAATGQNQTINPWFSCYKGVPAKYNKVIITFSMILRLYSLCRMSSFSLYFELKTVKRVILVTKEAAFWLAPILFVLHRVGSTMCQRGD